MTVTLLKPAEVAELLRIDVSSLYRLVKTGKIASYRIGSAVRISEEDLEKYLESRHMKPLTNVRRTRTTE